MKPGIWTALTIAALATTVPDSAQAQDRRETPLAMLAFQHICVPVLEQGKALDDVTQALALPLTGPREPSDFITMRWFWRDLAHRDMDPAPSIHANAETDLDDRPIDCSLIYDVHQTPITREQAGDEIRAWVATQPQFKELPSKAAGLSTWQHLETKLYLRVSSSYMDDGVVISYTPR